MISKGAHKYVRFTALNGIKDLVSTGKQRKLGNSKKLKTLRKQIQVLQKLKKKCRHQNKRMQIVRDLYRVLNNSNNEELCFRIVVFCILFSHLVKKLL